MGQFSVKIRPKTGQFLMKLNTLLLEGDVPVHVKTHVENYNKTVDAALNCCKE
jgi:hypothetical protein